MERLHRIQLKERKMKTDCSIFYDNFRRLAYLQVYAGVLHIHGLLKKPNDLHINRKSFRTFYGILTLLFTLIFTCISLAILMKLDNATLLDNNLSVIVLIGLAVRLQSSTIVSRIIGFWKCKDLLRLLKLSMKLERKINWKNGERTQLIIVSRLITLIHFVGGLIVMVILMFKCISLSEPYWFDLQHKFITFIMIGIIIFLCQYFNVVSIIYIPTWIVYFSIIFRITFRHIKRELCEIVNEYNPTKIRRLRFIYLDICDMIDMLDDALSPGIWELYTGNIIFCCLSSFYTLKQDVPTIDRIMFSGTFIGSYFLMLLPTIFCSWMKREVIEIAAKLNNFSYDNDNMKFKQQIIAFTLSCQNRKPSITGSKFFEIDLPLIVSISGTIVTYSIILIQSG